MPALGQHKTASSPLSNELTFLALNKYFPAEKIERILEETNKQSRRIRRFPAHLVTYHVIATGLYPQFSAQETLRTLIESIQASLPKNEKLKIPNRAGISLAKKRLGSEPLKKLYEETAQPIATKETRGAFFKNLRLAAIDGSTLDVADTPDNERTFGRPHGGRGKAAHPQLRFVALSEIGTGTIFATKEGAYTDSEHKLVQHLLPNIKEAMLILMDRGLYSYKFWKKTLEKSAELLCRIKKNAKLEIIESLSDGSYLSKIYPSWDDRRKDQNAIVVRVIDYEINGISNGEQVYRLITSILDPKEATAKELANLYHQRWGIELSFDEIKNHIREGKVVLRSLKPELVIQEFYGLLLAHFAVRGIMHEAALLNGLPCDRLSFTHSVRVIRRKMKGFPSFSPSKTAQIA